MNIRWLRLLRLFHVTLTSEQNQRSGRLSACVKGGAEVHQHWWTVLMDLLLISGPAEIYG